MNCEKAKQIRIIDVLHSIGIDVAKRSRNDWWYLSPFRNEATPSFKVDIEKNLYYDFGEGKGGNILSFITRLYQCDIKGALEILKKQHFSFQQPLPKSKLTTSKKIERYTIQAVLTISNPHLVSYLQKRGIRLNIAQKYCVEIHYRLNNKNYYAIGFKNDKGGFELRNQYVKMCLGIKYLTTIKNGCLSMIVFESWSDFISFLILYPEKETLFDYVILNSVATLKHLDKISCNYETIITCLDNDDAGNRATKTARELLSKKAKDGRKRYTKYKDLNDYLLAIKHNDLT